jgi:DNA polymerase III subunit gamma/tau
VYIIDEVHMLSTAAFNAFLKTLEEPPKHAKFILATTEKHKIIPTILSRCQVFNFNRIKTEDISRHLAYMARNEQVTAEPEALHVIAQKADGGLRDACSIFDQMVAFTGNDLTYKQVVENLNVLDYDYYFRVTDAFLEQRLPEVMVIFDDVLRKGFDGHNFLIGLGEHLRNILVSRDIQTLSLLEVSESLKLRYSEQSRNCSLPFLLRALAIISKTDVNYKSAKNQRLLVEMALMQLAYLNTSPEDEKKNDDTENGFGAAPATVSKPAPVSPIAETLKEPDLKFASKPSLSTSQFKIKSQFSLSDAKSLQPAGAAVAEIVEAPPSAYSQQEVTLDQLKSAILVFAESRQMAGSRQIATTLRTAVTELSGNQITLIIHNETQKEQLLLAKQEFIDELRVQLKNHSLSLEIRVSESPIQVKAYKPADVFKAMAERNPSLMELKKRFDLEIDY